MYKRSPRLPREREQYQKIVIEMKRFNDRAITQPPKTSIVNHDFSHMACVKLYDSPHDCQELSRVESNTTSNPSFLSGRSWVLISLRDVVGSNGTRRKDCNLAIPGRSPFHLDASISTSDEGEKSMAHRVMASELRAGKNSLSWARGSTRESTAPSDHSMGRNAPEANVQRVKIHSPQVNGSDGPRGSKTQVHQPGAELTGKSEASEEGAVTIVVELECEDGQESERLMKGIPGRIPDVSTGPMAAKSTEGKRKQGLCQRRRRARRFIVR
ncbi:hypothetical protein C8R44DRAFT_727340 [Mycena epipterygia]|nr:hypothetical protein C8R44DRAFT_727340 [Mycena epipterygia]